MLLANCILLSWLTDRGLTYQEYGRLRAVLLSLQAMLPELGHLGPILFRTYTTLLNLAILAGLALLLWQGHRREARAAAWFDAGLGALIGGLLIGRIFHVMIYWAYFTEHLDLTYQLWLGGIDWHGAVIGGLIGLALVSRWRGVRFDEAAGVLAFTLPIAAALIYLGCYATGCAYGREVESLAGYSPVIAAELPDLFGVITPRLSSQLYGIAASILILVILLIASQRVKRGDLRLWIVLALLGVTTFGIGFTRGDSMPMIGILRLDQILDLSIIIISLLLISLVILPFKLFRFYGPVGLSRK